MELSFATRQLREFCINPLAGDLSSDDVIDLKARLAELAAAETLGEMPFGVSIDPTDSMKVRVEVNDRWEIWDG